jgi:hypothetical protein
MNEIDRLAKLAIEVRSGRIEPSEIERALQCSERTVIKRSIDDLNQNLND